MDEQKWGDSMARWVGWVVHFREVNDRTAGTEFGLGITMTI